MNFMTSIIAGVVCLLTVSLILFGANKKAREFIMVKIKGFKEEMIWNGLIETLDISFLNYGFIIATSLLSKEENEEYSVPASQMIGIGTILVLFPIVSACKLYRT